MSEVLFKSERLRFRKWTEADRIAFRALNGDPRVMEFFPSVLTAEESDALVDRVIAHQENHGYSMYAVDRTDQGDPSFIGFIGIGHPRFEIDFGDDWMEIGWRTDPSSWGVGLATEGALKVLDYAFKYLKYDTIYSMTTLDNKRSEQVMKKIGMRHVGFFDHPLVEEESGMRKHTLYRIDRPLKK